MTKVQRKNQASKRGFVWSHFLILMSFLSVLIILIVFFIYHNAIEVMKEEICNVNMNQASQLENNMVRLIEQTDRLAAGICVQEESLMFWRSENPETLDEGFYSGLSSMLTSYAYSMNDFLSSIVLYSPAYNRILQGGMSSPYVVKDMENTGYNLGWIRYMGEMENAKAKTSFVYRAINDSYPYVLTVIKQYSYSNGWGALAVDMNLEKAYSVIWPQRTEGTSVWVLDESGQVLIRNRKNELFAASESFPELSHFERTSEQRSYVQEAGTALVVYSQRYCEDYGLYFVVVSELEDFQAQMWEARLEAVGIGILCVVITCLLVWIYVNIANKPLQSILSMLRDPVNYHDYTEQSNREVQEIVERIVSNIQMNDTLRNELEKRLDVLRQTQIQALKAQINPHFLFNTLNVIVTLIDAEVEDSKAAQVTADLADVLHYSLSDEDLVLLKDELKHTKKFIYILEQRYKGRFHTCIDIAPELLESKVPKLTLQPLIENAVFHGIAAKNAALGGVLTIKGKRVEYTFDNEKIWVVQIDIEDNGKGMSVNEIRKVKASLEKEQISMSHIGIQNVAKRLALLFPQRSRLEIRSKLGEGTCISLFFPYGESDIDTKSEKLENKDEFS